MGSTSNTDNFDAISKRLDLIASIMLSKEGFSREEVAKILGVSEKTIERMFVGKFRLMKRNS